MSLRFRLTLSEAQARAVLGACEVFSRLHTGQTDYLADELAYSPEFGRHERLEELRAGFAEAWQRSTGMLPRHYLSMPGPRVSDRARLAYDVRQVLLRALYDATANDPHPVFRPDVPQAFGADPLPEVEVVEEEG